jgi:predicted ATPase
LRVESGTIIQQLFRSRGEAQFALIDEPLPAKLSAVMDFVDTFFSTRVRYLGPLRDEPRPLYPLSTSGDSTDVGTKGEFTAAVLDVNRDVLVQYLSPESINAGKFDGELESRPLIEAVEHWLRYLGVSTGVRTKDRGSLGHELKVLSEGINRELDLTQVGVGVSQVLPIVVLSLLAPRGSTLIFEQPELHLHPKVQALLGDFFISMSRSYTQCVVETHSEYLLNRLRFRVAQSEPSIADQMKVYFAEVTNGETTYRPVTISDYGSVLEWPTGFFDESTSESEAILLAALQKRKRRRSSSDDDHDND